MLTQIVENPLIIAIAGAGAIVIGLLIYMLYVYWQRTTNANNFDEQLSEILSSDYDDFLTDSEESVKGGNKWSAYWYKLYTNAGVARYHGDSGRAGLETLLLGVIVGVIVGLALKNAPFGIIASLFLFLGLSFYLKKVADKGSEKLADQLPGFLFALKANIQANKTPDQAIISITDSMPEPLRSEIMTCKVRLLAGQSFEEAMEELAATTKSREIEDLARYMIVAARNGTSLEGAIDTIQGIVKSKSEINDEKKRAIAGTKFDLYTSVGAIPIAFIASYFLSEQAKEFWFKSILAWAILAVIGLLYIAGVFMSRKAARALDDKQR